MYLEGSQEIEPTESEHDLSTSGSLEVVDSGKKAKGRASTGKPKGRAYAGNSKWKPKGKPKGKNTEPIEVGPVFLLVSTADNTSQTCQTYGKDEWKEAATKALHDKSFKLFKAVELLLDITYTETAKL